MTLLVLGATGMLGQAMLAEAAARGRTAIGAARRGAARTCDLADAAAVSELFAAVEPSIVVNCAALTDLTRCEAEPAAAFAANARSVALVAEACRVHSARFAQISTDHFFTGDGRAAHDEVSPPALVNEYARSKYAGEAFALTVPGALVLRTNITGRRGWADKPTFAEWLIGALEREEPLTLFEDYFTSTLDSRAFARACFDLLEGRAKGLLNLASSQIASKLEFATALAARMAVPLAGARAGSVRGLTPRRAESAGLDVRRAEALLGRRLPDLDQVVDALVTEKKCDTPRPS
jgi:dTDP-4-dehydrorhamnose reductase